MSAFVKQICWHADPMHLGGSHASARSSALAATVADVIVLDTYVAKNRFGRPLGLGGSTG